MTEESSLPYVTNLIIQTYRKRGLDEVYIRIKMDELYTLRNIEALRYAVNFLDSENLAIFADLLEVTVAELIVTRNVLGKI